MSSNKRYFRLNPECFMIPGVDRGVIYNLNSSEAIWCDEANTAALLRSEVNHAVDPDAPPYRDLEQRGWGFFADAPPFVDKLRSYNVFREKRLWRETPFVTMAILQVTNRCGRGCASCREAFCPICTVFDDADGAAAPLTVDEWCDLIDRLARYGARHMVMTGGEAMLHDALATLVRRAAGHGIAVQVHTSGLIAPAPDFPRVAFSIGLTAAADLPEIVRNFAGFDQVSVLSDGVDPDLVRRQLPPAWQVMSVSARSPRVGKGDLVATDFERFFARRLGDGCLNGKITVGFDGRVLPCFGHKGPAIANVRKGGLAGAVKALVEEYWTVPLDKLDPNRACTRCEFRYACPACRYHVPADNCAYDVDRGRWAETPPGAA